MKSRAVLAFWLIWHCCFGQSFPQNGTLVLKNEHIELQMDLPGSGYHFSRFDFTGKITSLRYKNILLTGTETRDGKDSITTGRGFYNEFGIFEAIGFDSIEAGEWFPKIGIGLLKKEDSRYHFSHPYELEPADFSVIPAHEKLTIQCISNSQHAYSYLLTKEIVLLENGFCIRYHLKNTGAKTIRTNEYVHNFIALDTALIGKDYRLKFNFDLIPEKINAQVNTENLIRIGPKEITFNGTPKEQFYFSNLVSGNINEPGWELINTRKKIGIRETTNFHSSLICLWGWEHVISPEIFIEIQLEPGESKNWTRTYTIFEIE